MNQNKTMNTVNNNKDILHLVEIASIVGIVIFLYKRNETINLRLDELQELTTSNYSNIASLKKNIKGTNTTIEHLTKNIEEIEERINMLYNNLNTPSDHLKMKDTIKLNNERIDKSKKIVPLNNNGRNLRSYESPVTYTSSELEKYKNVSLASPVHSGTALASNDDLEEVLTML